MPPNINPDTGIAYGVISAKNAPILHDEIFQKGVNQRIEDRNHKIRSAIEALCHDMLDKEDVEEVIDHIIGRADEVESQNDSGDLEIITFRDEKGNEFQLGELGGAPLIWCIKTSEIVQAPLCSPCVPNAGDLDNLSRNGATNAVACYGVPAEYLEGHP
jgi:hypothetical protein